MDDAFDAAVSGSRTLRAQLRLYETAKWSVNSKGQIIASTAANGHATALSAPGSIQGYNPLEVQVLFRDLINLNDEVVTQEELTDNTANREAIKTEMMARLVPCYESEPDFSGLRCVG